MEHLLLKASTTATDQGLFEAVISTATIDRERDVVDPVGMVRALRKWANTGKRIPLAWNHSQAAADQIGYIDPTSARAVGGEVHASGWIDQSSAVGADAWRLVKAGTLGFSFGYLVPEGGSRPRKGGGRHITELDVFEVTATPTPMNNDTRVLGFKQMADGDGAEDEDDPAELLGQMISLAQDFIDDETDPQDVAAMRQIMRILLALQGAEADESDGGKGLRRRADLVAFEAAVGREPPSAPPAPAPDLPAGAEWLFSEHELKAVRAGDLKAAWTTAYVNGLPDGAFLYVAPGGTKDGEGKTVPRSNRMFPYKSDAGAVDLPHLRNALARIPQSNLSQALKDQLTAKAQRILDAQKSLVAAGRAGEEASDSPRPVDPLRRKADTVALDFLSDGESRRRSRPRHQPPKPGPELDLRELKRRTREITLTALSGVTTNEQV
jgi:hypothetical protein